ncbi:MULTISPECIES: hypothetical protein [unclassified Rubrivivax]|uniref:DUF7673 family protein n=1 Tax=unclassified Rubrivivax TaxID=2649762 RepID=UPI001E457404|nr:MULTISPECIES: hypothetical protein [unclassified Rubrivivax]MCC9598311.1 hypothetical protein [Rubrivivax sp. JA1055]MCC9645433.1 hypothetical protein [Rubrivivax sp. JA1029]
MDDTDDVGRVVDEFFLYTQRVTPATEKGAQAFERLLRLAEHHDSGQVARVAGFIASVHDGATFRWDPFELRMLDVEISDDMLACLDALRWGQHDLHRLVPDGERRVLQVLRAWALVPTAATPDTGAPR